MTNLFQSTGLLCNLANTCVTCKEEAFTVRYHNTEIMQYWPETGHVVLNFGDKQTVSTVKRMNQALSAIGLTGLVYQYKKNLYCRLITDSACFELPFINGVCEFNRFTGERMA